MDRTLKLRKQSIQIHSEKLAGHGYFCGGILQKIGKYWTMPESSKGKVCHVTPMVQKQDSYDSSDNSSDDDDYSSRDYENSSAEDDATSPTKIQSSDTYNANNQRRHRRHKMRPKRYGNSSMLGLKSGDVIAQEWNITKDFSEKQAAETLLAFTNREDVQNKPSDGVSVMSDVRDSVDNSDLIPSLLRKPPRFPTPSVHVSSGTPYLSQAIGKRHLAAGTGDSSEPAVKTRILTQDGLQYPAAIAAAAVFKDKSLKPGATAQPTIRQRVLDIIQAKQAEAGAPQTVSFLQIPGQQMVPVLVQHQPATHKHTAAEPKRNGSRRSTAPSRNKHRGTVKQLLGTRSASGLTFSNHGNIMATGIVANSPTGVVVDGKKVVSMSTLAEETLRMREAYGVPVTAKLSGATKSATGINKDDQPPKLVPISLENLALYKKAREGTKDAGLKSGGSTSVDVKDDLVLDLRMTSDGKNIRRLSQEESEALDLRIVSENGVVCYTSEGALDLTVKRKPGEDLGVGSSTKRLQTGKPNTTTSLPARSLAFIPIWDLSSNKTKAIAKDEGVTKATRSEQKPAEPKQPKSEVTTSQTKVKEVEQPECEETNVEHVEEAEVEVEEVTVSTEMSIKQEPVVDTQEVDSDDSSTGDHNYFSTSPSTYTVVSPSPGLTVLDSFSEEKAKVALAIKQRIKSEVVDEDEEVDVVDDDDENDDDDDNVSSCDSTGAPLPTVVSGLHEDAEAKASEMEEVQAVRHLLQLSLPDADKTIPSEEVIQEALQTARKSKDICDAARRKAAREGFTPQPKKTIVVPAKTFIMRSDSSNPRQRLRPWLESQINSGQIKGLEWVDRGQGMFKVPWKHGGKHDWTHDDSRIFMEWARHTGRYREGIDDEDYATWKTRLRCAFNKAPDIVEVKDQTNLSSPEPYRVYRLIPKKDLPNTRHMSPVHSPDDDEKTKLRMIQTTVRTMVPSVVEDLTDGGRMKSYPSDLQSVPSMDLVQRRPIDSIVSTLNPLPSSLTTDAMVTSSSMLTGSGLLTTSSSDIEVTDVTVVDEEPYPSDPTTGAPSSNVPKLTELVNAFESRRMTKDLPSAIALSQPQVTSVITSQISSLPSLPSIANMDELLPIKDINNATLITQTDEHGTQIMILEQPPQQQPTRGLTVQLKYQWHPQVIEDVSEGVSCHVDISGQRQDQAGVNFVTFPPLPNQADMSAAQVKIRTLLPFIEKGIDLVSDNGDIYATRYCRCGVHYVSDATEGECVKLRCNEHHVKIFDFDGYFLPALTRYQTECATVSEEGPIPTPPSDTVHLLCGQLCRLEDINENILISISVTSNKAREMLNGLQVLATEEVMDTDETEIYQIISTEAESMLTQALPSVSTPET